MAQEVAGVVAVVMEAVMAVVGAAMAKFQRHRPLATATIRQSLSSLKYRRPQTIGVQQAMKLVPVLLQPATTKPDLESIQVQTAEQGNDPGMIPGAIQIAQVVTTNPVKAAVKATEVEGVGAAIAEAAAPTTSKPRHQFLQATSTVTFNSQIRMTSRVQEKFHPRLTNEVAVTGVYLALPQTVIPAGHQELSLPLVIALLEAAVGDQAETTTQAIRLATRTIVLVTMRRHRLQ